MTRQKLEAVLAGLGPVAVAVSGGVDSLTLATLAHRLAPGTTLVVHAVSPAVPEEATARVRAEGAREGWTLRVIEAGERTLAIAVFAKRFSRTSDPAPPPERSPGPVHNTDSP